MELIVGLGNPGSKYENTRHNAGFLFLDTFQREQGLPEFTLSKKHSALLSGGTLNGKKVLLAKPQTFMNNSGKAVVSLGRLSFAKLSLPKEPKKLIVVHDDIDIPLGEVKVSENRGSAGHKGVQSIIQTLGTKNFTRVRVGIQPKAGKPADVEEFVLRPFRPSELPLLNSSFEQAASSLLALLSKA